METCLLSDVIKSKIHFEGQQKINKPVVIFISAVNVCPTLEEDRGHREGGELADRIAAHAGGVAVDCQVEGAVAVLPTWMEFQESENIKRCRILTLRSHMLLPE